MTAPDRLIFVTGSTTFEIPDYWNLKDIGNKNGIQSEHFTVGGYVWVAEFYPQGIDELVPKDETTVSVRVLDATEEVWARCIFQQWNWYESKWENLVSSNLMNLQPSGDKARYCRNYPRLSKVRWMMEDDERLRIKCTLLVIPRPPAPAPYLKSDGFHMASYAPPNTPNNEYTKLPRQPTVRIYCEANKDFSVTIRNGNAVLAPADSNDYYQHWIKDMTYGDKVKDKNGFPAFALVNSVTGQALQNRAVENKEITLVPYNPNCLEDSVKWSVIMTGFRAIRIADKVSIVMTAIGSYNNTIFTDGGKIVVKKWFNSPVQRWKIVPYNCNVPY